MALIETYYGPNGPDDKSELFTADSFLNFIRRSNPKWHENEPPKETQEWVYRGHWNSDWTLIPSVARDLDTNIIKKQIVKKLEYLNTFKEKDFIKIRKNPNLILKSAYEMAAHESHMAFIKLINEIGILDLPEPKKMNWSAYTNNHLRGV